MEEERERETDGIMGRDRDRVLQAEKKGLSQKFGSFASQITCRMCREEGRGSRYIFRFFFCKHISLVSFDSSNNLKRNVATTQS